jgi:hypothetical protein
VTSFDVVDVGFIHLDAGREAETAEWVAFQLGLINYTTQLYPYNAASWDEVALNVSVVQAGARFTAILFSHRTPELMCLAIPMILQGNSDWILPIRCEDCPTHPGLAELPHFDIMEVADGVSNETAPLISMAQHIKAVLHPLQDPPPTSSRRRWRDEGRW